VEVIVAVVVGALLGVFCYGFVRGVRGDPGGWLEERTARKVVVHTRDSRSIEGLLTTVAPDGLVLEAARYLEGDGVPLGGVVWVPRDRVEFLQLV
jgi:hypothetical protein